MRPDPYIKVGRDDVWLWPWYASVVEVFGEYGFHHGHVVAWSKAGAIKKCRKEWAKVVRERENPSQVFTVPL